jgi:PAS domain S-box-containing protein
MDARGRITEFNPAAERTFGYRRSEMLGRPMAEVMIPPALRERHRRGLEEYLKTGEGPVIGTRVELTAMRSDGSEFPVELTITRIASPGEPMFTAYLRDISERKLAEAERQDAVRRWEFLAQASAVIASSLDYEETLGALAELVVPFIADWCSVDIVDADGTIRRLGVAHADPARAELARVAAVYPPDPAGRHPRTRVLRTGRSVLIPEVTDDGLAQVADGPEHLRVLRALGYRSAMIVALTARGRTLGALTFATAESGRQYVPRDLAFAEELARRAAIAMDNARLYRDAQEASRLKDEFLATVSHELRTPLQAMLGWVGVLRQGKVNPDRKAQALEIIERAGRAQAKLIEDLLDVSRIVTGRLHLDVFPTDLASVLEEALDVVRPAAEAKGVKLTAALDRSIGTVAGDPVRLQQAVSNLLSNAVKFTPSGGRAEIRLERNSSEISIVVKDTGQGIRTDFLPHVFEPFRQADAAGRRREGGLGLGLAIVRRVVELHGGRVDARSEGEGRGTEILVTLPFRPLAEAASGSG